MSWTTPRTYVTGELVTATILNTHLRDNMLWLKSDPLIGQNVIAKGDTTPYTGLTIGATAIPADVGAVYVEAWGHVWATSHDGHNNLRVILEETTAGELMAWTTYGWYSIPSGPFYLRTGDLSWAGTTRQVAVAVGGDVSAGFNTTGTSGQSATSEVRIRLMRSY